MERLYSEIKRSGYVILPDYLSQSQLVELNGQFHKLFDKVTPFVATAEQLNRDKRIFNADDHVDLSLFSEDRLFLDIAQQYFGDHKESHIKEVKKLYPMANYLEFDGDTSNSGGTWHRDNHNGMLKTVLYLTDCDVENGCLQFLTNSSPQHIGKPSTSHKLDKRYYDVDLEQILKENSDIKVKNLTGKAGTVIIFDASYIHRGNIIQKGSRKAVTLYPYRHGC